MSDQAGKTTGTDGAQGGTDGKPNPARAADSGAGSGGTDDDDDANGGAGGDGGTDDGARTLSPDDARKLRSESRNLRQRLKAAEQELEQRRKAEETEQQRLERELTTAAAKVEQAEARVRELEVQSAATKLGVRPEAADVVAALIDWTEVDATDSKDVERAIRAIVKERPFLSARPDGLDGGQGRGAGAKGETDMNTVIRRAAGRA